MEFEMVLAHDENTLVIYRLSEVENIFLPQRLAGANLIRPGQS